MNYIRGFNGLRAFSVLFVVLTHLGFYTYLLEKGFYHSSLDILFSGNTGVQVFFTLSGFLITLILLKEFNRKGTISLKNFYIRRFLRLLPALIILLVIVAVFMYVKLIPRSSVGWLLSATYLYNFIPLKWYTGELGHTWSLAVEEQFYLLWPLALLIFSTTKKRFYVIGIALTLCFIAAFLWRSMDISKAGVIYELSSLYMVDRWFLPALAPIMVGALAAVILLEYYVKIKAALQGKNWPLMVFVFFYLLPLILPNAVLPISAFIQAIGIAVLLLWIYCNQQSVLCNFLEIKWLNYIGKISYGIYIYQGFFLRTGPEESAILAQYFPYDIILALVAAVISFELIEKPVLKLKTKFS